MSMLVNTYLQTLRKEKWILSINVASVILSFISTVVLSIVFHNLALSIASIAYLIAFRCILAELLLSRLLKIDLKKDIILEFILCTIFIISGWFFGSWLGLGIYLIVYLYYVFIKRKEIENTIEQVRLILCKN